MWILAVLTWCACLQGCVVYVCPNTDTRILDAIGGRLKVKFEYEARCMTMGTREACLVMSPDVHEFVSDGGTGVFRGCTDMNYVRMRNNASEVVYEDIYKVFGGGGGRISLCNESGDVPTWCFYARWDGGECASPEDVNEGISMLDVVLFVVCLVLTAVVVRVPLFVNPSIIAAVMIEE